MDHIIPLALHPEFGNTIANLTLMPERMNMAKQDKMTSRAKFLLPKLRKADL